MSKIRRHNGATARALEYIRQLIEAQELREGEKLIPERLIAAELNVGRPAVREAIKALCILGVLESRVGAGTYIRSLDALRDGWPGKVSALDTSFDIIELFEVRRIIEPRAAALAAARAGKRELTTLEQNLRAQQDHLEDLDRMVDLDYEFHDAVFQAIGNRTLYVLRQALQPLLIRSHQTTYRTTPDLQSVIDQHRLIFDAIRAHDPVWAELAMTEHLHKIATDLISVPKR